MHNNLTQQQQLGTKEEIDRSISWQATHKNKDGEYVTEFARETGATIVSSFWLMQIVFLSCFEFTYLHT